MYCNVLYVCSYENTTCTCDSPFRNGKGKILGTYTMVKATSCKSPLGVVSSCVTVVVIKMAENTILP